MRSRSARAVVVLAVVGLAAAVFSVPSGASAPAGQAVQGIQKKSIDIAVIVPDIDALREQGIEVSNQNTADFMDRFAGYVDAYGPINGRKVNLIQVGWDPIDATSFDRVCTEATQDNKPFLVINGSGYQTSSIGCISVDNATPFISGDMGYSDLFDASGKNLLALGLPAEVSATGAVELVVETGAIPETAKIGIVSSNIPGLKATGDTLESALTKAGFEVVSKVEVNGLAADAGLVNRELTAAVTTFQADGVDTVFNIQSFTQAAAFFDEAEKVGANFASFAIDGQANTCTPFSVTRVTAAAEGTTCITAWDPRALPTKDGVKDDNALEAKCRKQFDEFTGKEHLIGGASGPQEIGGVSYEGDLAPNECTIASFLLPALEKAGKNITWDKVYKILLKTKGPAAYLSEGKGGFGKNKPYFSGLTMHFTTVAVANADTPADANGLFNGCSIPAPCWIPQVIGDQEWFPISGKPK
jgi:hypothetical protein